jgi:L-lactate dehydrogenase (cytochrome)
MFKEKPNLVSATELSKHNTATDLWIAVNSTVWNITEFAPTHPGGMDSILHL